MARTPRSGITPSLRWKVFARDGFRCRYCGAAPPDCALVIDHVQAVARGGGDVPDNLMTACETCNAGKAASLFSGIYVMQVYYELGDKLLGLLNDAWCAEAGVDWSPDADLLIGLVMQARDWAQVEDTVRAFAARIRSGEMDWRVLSYWKIMGAFECFISDVTRNSHPSLEELSDEDIKANFWARLDALLAD